LGKTRNPPEEAKHLMFYDKIRTWELTVKLDVHGLAAIVRRNQLKQIGNITQSKNTRTNETTLSKTTIF